jgi:hypothetical protein
LRDTVAATGLRAIDAEHRGLVAIESDGLTMAPEVPTGGVEIVEGRFRVTEVKLHEPAGGVINVDKQRATSSSLFEPLMVAAIDLNELTRATRQCWSERRK